MCIAVLTTVSVRHQGTSNIPRTTKTIAMNAMGTEIPTAIAPVLELGLTPAAILNINKHLYIIHIFEGLYFDQYCQ